MVLHNLEIAGWALDIFNENKMSLFFHSNATQEGKKMKSWFFTPLCVLYGITS